MPTRRFDAVQRQVLRDLLAEAYARAHHRVDAATREVDEIIAASDLTPADDEHDPDGATVAYERAKATALAAQARADLAEVVGATERLRSGTYGRCERCDRAIPLERLRARPAARTCVACAAT